MAHGVFQVLCPYVQGRGFRVDGVLIRGFNISYHITDAILITIDPYYGNLIQVS